MRAALIALAAFVGLAAPAAAGPPGAAAIVAPVVQGFVVPRYRAFAEATGLLEGAMGELCATPSAGALDDARRKFGAVAAAWSSIEVIRFGPVTEDGRMERILYWPDRRGTGLKQVQEILALRDASATAAATLAGKSVAVQGLGALEFVLHGSGYETLSRADGGFRCAYGRAVAANLARIAADIALEWDDPHGIAAEWTAPGPGNGPYRNDGESLRELIGVLVHGLEMVRDVRIGGFLAETPDGDRPGQALFRRSSLTVGSIRLNLAALAEIHALADFGAHMPEDRRWIADGIRFEFGNAERALAGLSGRPVEEILGDAELRNRLAYARLVTSSLSEQIAGRLAGEFGVTAGFSSLDGD